MATYVYRCPKCEDVVEVMFARHDDPPPKCNHHKHDEREMERVPQPVKTVFKNNYHNW